MEVDKFLSDIAAENKEVENEYIATVKLNTQRSIEALVNIMARSNGVLAVRWGQFIENVDQYDVSSPVPVRGVEVKFDPHFFPINEEDSADREYEDGFIPRRQLKNFVERGMDIMNFQDLERVEKALDEIFKVMKALTTMDVGLNALFGKKMIVTINKDGTSNVCRHEW